MSYPGYTTFFLVGDYSSAEEAIQNPIIHTNLWFSVRNQHWYARVEESTEGCRLLVNSCFSGNSHHVTVNLLFCVMLLLGFIQNSTQYSYVVHIHTIVSIRSQFGRIPVLFYEKDQISI